MPNERLLPLPELEKKGRPDFIPREVFREWMTSTRLNKLMEIDGITPAGYIGRCERNGRPIPRKGTLCRPLDLVARARAAGHSIGPPKADRLKASIEELETRYAEMKSVIEGPAHQVEMHHLSQSLTNRRLLSEAEIVAESSSAPHLTGVYFLVQAERVVYIGQSVNILARIAQHRASKDFDRFAFVPCEREDLDALESLYIHFIKPPLNGRHRHDGSHQAPLSLPALIGSKRLRKQEAV